MGFILLSIGIISATYYFGTKDIIIKQCENDMVNQTKLVGENINDQIKDILKFSDTLENLITTSIDLDKVANDYAEMENYENQIRPIIKNEIIMKGMNSGRVIFDPDTIGGHHLISFVQTGDTLQENPEYDFSTDNNWRKGPYEKGEVWTVPYYWPKWDKTIITYSRSIQKDGKMLGTVSSEFYLDDLKDKIGKLKLYESGYYVLMDENFNFLYDRDPTLKNLRTMAGGSLAYVADKIQNDHANEGIITYTYKGIDKVMAYYRLDNGWIISATAPINEQISDLYYVRNIVILCSVLIFITGLVAAYIFGRSTANRIIKIKDAAVELSHGNLDVQLKVKARDELGALADAFRTMAGNIKTVQKQLSESNILLEETNNELVRTSALLQEEKETLDITLRSIGDGIIATDSKGIIKMVNKATEELTGWKRIETEGRPLTDVFEIFDETTLKRAQNPVELVLKKDVTVELSNHTGLRTKSGSLRSIAHCAAPIKDKEGKTVGVVLVFRDVTEEKKQQMEINHLSNHDILTGLYNRVYAEKEMDRLENEGDIPAAIIMGDVNGLKIANDVFGHEEGDRLLKTIANIVQQALRPGDILSRWGGDEFVIILPDTDAKTALTICQNIYAACEEYSKQPYDNTLPSISLGYSAKQTPEKNLRSVLKSAEDLMYKRKLLESRSTHSSIIASMKKTLYEKSHETEEHTSRLSKLCMRIAGKMNLSENEKNDMALFAVLHDIGKITIDDRILNKPGSLNEEEWLEMKKHPETGCRIAMSAVELAHISEYILTHHEKWDGSGYPQGLKKKQIPLLSRILAVVDAYDAMTQDRVYRHAMPHEQAIAEIKANSSRQFDPEIVNIFLEIINEND